MPSGKPRDKVYWVVQERVFVTWKAHALFGTKHQAEAYVAATKGNFKIDRVVLA
jgi:hypothetical protein